MVEWFLSRGPVMQGFLATLGTYLLTAVGTLAVFCLVSIPPRLTDALTAAAAGIMAAASCWSLLEPALARRGVLPAVVGLLVGGAVLYALDRWLPHEHPPGDDDAARAAPRPWLLMIAMTMHNIPEGLAVGVAFGAGAPGPAAALALGIGIQNIPEGLAVALPLRRQGMSRLKAFWWGQLSAAVEPVAGLAGAALVLTVRAALPYAMAFAAGAMLYVIVVELLPDATRRGAGFVPAFGFLGGFAVMMALDNAFG